MIRSTYTPDRGDIVLVDFTPYAGTEMKGEHRALVLSEKGFSTATGWMVVCPITTKIKGSPFEVAIPPGLKAVGCVVASEMRTVDYMARGTKFMERASSDLLQKVQAIACATIGCS